MKIEKGTSAVLKLYRFFKVRFSQFLLAQKCIRLKCRTQAQTVTERSVDTNPSHTFGFINKALFFRCHLNGWTIVHWLVLAEW